MLLLVKFQDFLNLVGNLMLNNIIADGFSRIKNAQLAQNLETTILYSKFMLDIIVVLRNEGYIRGFTLDAGKIKIFLKYLNRKPTFRNINIISKPSRRVYYSMANLLKKTTQTGTFLVSTPQGLFSSRDAIKRNLGGEVVCYIN